MACDAARSGLGQYWTDSTSSKIDLEARWTLGEKTFRSAARIHLDGIRARVTQPLTDDEARIIADALERIRLANSPSLKGWS